MADRPASGAPALAKGAPRSFGRRVMLLAGGTALGQVLVIGASPLLTRIYSPDDFGILGAYSAVLALVVAVVTLRYHLAIPLPERDDDGLLLVLVSLASVALFSALLAAALVLFGNALFGLANAEGLARYGWVLVLGVLGSGAYQVFTYWAIRRQTFRPLAMTKVTQGAVLAASQVGIGLLSAGPLGLLLGDALGRTAGTGLLARLTLSDRGRLGGVSWRRARDLIVRYRRFPTFSTLSALLNTGGLQVPALLILAFYGPQAAGWYALTMRVFGMPMSLLGTSASQVYTSSIAELARKGESSADLYVRTAFRLLLIGLPIAGLAALLGPHAFAFVFSAEWTEAGVYARLLAPMFLVQFVASPLSQTLNVLERQDVQFVWDAFRLVLVGGALLVANASGWSATHAIAAVSIALGLAYVVLIVVCWRLTSASRGRPA